jgi:ADP-ribose pyrophosphatase
MAEDEIADRPAKVTVSKPERLGDGFRPYHRYHLTLHETGGAAIEQQRDLLLAGKVIAVFPIDIAREEIVFIRQFRLAAHIANGNGDLVEIVAGRVEEGETLEEAARRECGEEIGVTPDRVIPIVTYLTTPGLTDEEVTIYVATVDAARVPEGERTCVDGERVQVFGVGFDAALAALAAGTVCGSPVIIALQWLALNRNRLRELLVGAR